MNASVTYSLPVRLSSIIVCLALLVAIWFPSASAAAQDDSTRVESSAEFIFGEIITFALTVHTTGSVKDLELVIRSGQGPSEVIAIGVPEPSPAPTFQARVARDLKQHPLLPFSTVEYWWRIKILQSNGSHHIESEHYMLDYLDNRFDWQTARSANIKVHWYGGDMGFGQMAADVASIALGEIAADLEISPPANISIYVYDTSDHFSSDAQVSGREWVGGQAYPDMGVVLVATRPGGSAYLDMRRDIPHELAHVMLYRLLGSGYGALPGWLNEGLAMRYESVPRTAYAQILQTAEREDVLLSLASLCGAFPLGGSDVSLAYSESGSIVDYIYTRWGRAKMRELLLTYKDGATCASGVQRALATSLTSLQADWRADILRAHPIGIVWRRGRDWILVFALPAIVIAAFSLWPARRRRLY